VNFITYFEPPYLLNYNYIVVPLPTGFFVSAYFNGEGVQEFLTPMSITSTGMGDLEELRHLPNWYVYLFFMKKIGILFNKHGLKRKKLEIMQREGKTRSTSLVEMAKNEASKLKSVCLDLPFMLLAYFYTMALVALHLGNFLWFFEVLSTMIIIIFLYFLSKNKLGN